MAAMLLTGCGGSDSEDAADTPSDDPAGETSTESCVSAPLPVITLEQFEATEQGIAQEEAEQELGEGSPMDDVSGCFEERNVLGLTPDDDCAYYGETEKPVTGERLFEICYGDGKVRAKASQ